MVGPQFVSVTKQEGASWDPLVGPVAELIRNVIASGEIILPEAALKEAMASRSGDGDIERRIKEVLDREIRPAVAQDGGDIVFYGYEDGVVTLHLQGACSSCPSSIMTLKMGVENRLKQVIPEVKEVVQV
jgi:Fe-S cluster biogenesis protein NfuA